jgi:hypothetical protein
MTPGHAFGPVGSEGERWHGREPVGRVQGIRADVTGRDSDDRDGACSGELLQAIQMGVDSSRLPARVGENRRIERGNAAMQGE